MIKVEILNYFDICKRRLPDAQLEDNAPYTGLW
jgi:hypothetical protein